MSNILSLSAVVLLSTSSFLSADDWPAFRGRVTATNRAHARGTGYPQTWSSNEKIAWRYELPAGGNSSPVVSNGKVFVTYADQGGTRRNLTCVDADTGEKLWTQSVIHEKNEPTHKTNPHCGSSPASDGQTVVVWHGSAGVFAYSLDGKEIWNYETGPVHHIWGTGSSPIIYEGVVYLNIGPGERTYVLALDLQTGEQLWKTPEPGGNLGEDENGKRIDWIGSWSSPQILEHSDQPQLICAQPTRVVAYDLKTGDKQWWCTGLNNLPRGSLMYTDPIFHKQMGLVLGGFKGPAIAFRLPEEPETGDITDLSRLWRITHKNPQRIGSGVIVGDYLYAPSAGINGIQCLELKTGTVKWTERHPHAFWGSMVMAEGLIYVTDQSGTTLVIRPDPTKFDLVSANRLEERSNSTPALVDGKIYLRTYSALYCISQ